VSSPTTFTAGIAVGGGGIRRVIQLDYKVVTTFFVMLAAIPSHESIALDCSVRLTFCGTTIFGDSEPINLAKVGLLDEYIASMSVQLHEERMGMAKRAQLEASRLCKDCEFGTRTGVVKSKGDVYHQVTDGCLFQMGSTILSVMSSCDVTANCASRTFTAACNSDWSLRDWFEDPLSIKETTGIPFEPAALHFQSMPTGLINIQRRESSESST
jgi:hypothetical protein